MTIEATGPNAQQIEFWNGDAANTWTENQDRMDRLFAPMTEAALGKLGDVRGQRVLDVGCGCGDTTLKLHDLGARATGIDISAPMLARARSRAGGKRDVEFLLADAAQHTFVPAYDALFSRFGVMFFADPIAAFRNLRSALVARGRIAFICWRAGRDNAWMAVPASGRTSASTRAAAGRSARTRTVRVRGPRLCRKHPLEAGYSAVSIEPFTTDLVLGRSVDEALGFTALGPLGRQLAAVEPDVRNRALIAIRDTLAAHERNGEVRLAASCWLVTARESPARVQNARPLFERSPPKLRSHRKLRRPNERLQARLDPLDPGRQEAPRFARIDQLVHAERLGAREWRTTELQTLFQLFALALRIARRGDFAVKRHGDAAFDRQRAAFDGRPREHVGIRRVVRRGRDTEAFVHLNRRPRHTCRARPRLPPIP